MHEVQRSASYETGSAPGQVSPGLPLQEASRWRTEASRWRTGFSWPPPVRREEVWWAAVAWEVAEKQVNPAATSKLEPFLAAGLVRRLGLSLSPESQRTYRALMGLGLRPPEGIAVCNGFACATVFRPRAKAYAAKCDRCHAWDPGPPDLPSHSTLIRVGGGERFGGKSRRVEVFATCPICGEDFWRSPDQVHCSGRCRTRASRSRTPAGPTRPR